MPRTWGIVLAGGKGRRLADVTGGVPKQFWNVGTGQTLLENTIDRLSPVASPERMVVVVDAAHEAYVRKLDLAGPHVLFQPRDRGTVAGVVLSLLPIVERDPEAIVVLSPADHGVTNVGLYRSGLLTAVRRIRARGAGIILFGVEPDTNDGSYGWIQPGRPCGHGHTREVAGFVEKPGAERALALFGTGAVWSTMVLVAAAQSLLQLIASRQPQLSATVMAAWREAAEPRARSLPEAYRTMRAVDFSSEVLAGAPGLEVFTWPRSMGWSDLGTPDRLFAWLERAPSAAAASSAA